MVEEYPWTGRHLPVREGIRLHYLDEGRGPPVLMVHGNPTWSFYWRNLVKGLSDDHRCIVPDHIGCGRSDKPAAYPYTLEARIDDLSQLVDALDLRDITLVVHDWGGPIGLGTALRHPERFRRLVILNTGVFDGPLPTSIKLCRWPVLGPLAIRGLNGFVRAGLLRATEKPLPRAVAKGYLAPYRSWADRRAVLRFVQDIPLEEDHPTRGLFFAVDAGLPALRDLPTLLIWGEKDFCFTPDYRRGFEARFPDAEVHALPDAGHWVMEDAHERVVPLVRDFLHRHPLPASHP